MYWFTSDTHLGHTNIIKHCNRPFDSVQDMDNVLINNINNLVGPNDTLYHLGDFAFRNARDLKNYRDAINCKTIHLILGNHDRLRTNDKRLFSTVSGYKEIRWAKQTIVLCHYPLMRWYKCYYGSFMLHGHCHNSLKHTMNNIMDVGVDGHNFLPLNLDKIFEIFKE